MSRGKFRTMECGKPQEETTSELSLRTATALDILKDGATNFLVNGDMNMAAAIAFYFILSIVPLLMLTIFIAGFVFGSNPHFVDDLTRLIQSFHPYFSGDILRYFDEIQKNMKVIGSMGIILLTWSSSLIFDSAQTAMNVIFRVEKPRNFLMSKLTAIAMIPVGWVMMFLIIGVTYLGAVMAKHPMIPGSAASTFGASLLDIVFRILLPFLITMLFFSLVYKIIPSGKISWGNALSGGALFACLTEISKHVFTWYISNYSRYHLIYGSLETVMIFIIWVFYVGVILLLCAEFVASYRRRDLLLLEKMFLAPGGER